MEILDELEEEEPDLRISKLDANKNLEIAGTLVVNQRTIQVLPRMRICCRGADAKF